MIFVTVGSHPTFPFQRLIDSLHELCTDKLIVQYGPAQPPKYIADATPWLSFAEMLAHMRLAKTVICHAGIGSILCAQQAGHVPIVMPRRKQFGETVDDHQVQIATLLARTGGVRVVTSPAELRAMVEDTRPELQLGDPQPRRQLIAAVRDALVEESR